MLCLETPRLFLRDYTPADLEAYFQLKADPEAMYYLPGARLFTREAAAADLQRVLEDQAGSQRRCFFFHMELKPSREPVGSIGYTLLDSVPQGWLADAGYFSFPKLWGKGYTTEALRQVLSFAFVQGKVYRMSASCFAENAGSERVLQKCGFTQEAGRTTFRRHGGERKPRVHYRLLKEEWASL